MARLVKTRPTRRAAPCALAMWSVTRGGPSPIERPRRGAPSATGTARHIAVGIAAVPQWFCYAFLSGPKAPPVGEMGSANAPAIQDTAPGCPSAATPLSDKVPVATPRAPLSSPGRKTKCRMPAPTCKKLGQSTAIEFPTVGGPGKTHRPHVVREFPGQELLHCHDLSRLGFRCPVTPHCEQPPSPVGVKFVLTILSMARPMAALSPGRDAAPSPCCVSLCVVGTQQPWPQWDAAMAARWKTMCPVNCTGLIEDKHSCFLK